MKERNIKDFLSIRLEKGSKLLLGLSGGPDSMALLYFLLECRLDLDFSLHLAHVDHGWRSESKEEAEALKNIALQLKLPFYLHTLKNIEGSDLENRCRQERLAFFSRLHQEHHFQALLLGHHAGDQAETVLKRVFEGSGIQALGGLQLERKWGDLCIWRPLLSFRKEELIRYLTKKHIPYFEDVSNTDPKYLRSRMRTQIFPELERLFGKHIQKNCVRLGALCEEVSSYFDEKCVEMEKKCIQGPFGDYLPLQFHSTELKYFLKRYTKDSQLSYEALELLLKLMQQRSGNRQVHAPPITFHVNREYLFILKDPFPDFFEEIEKWNKVGVGDWKSFWQGEVVIPKGNYQIEKLSNLKPNLRKKLKQWYGSHHVPSFFYEKAPIFIDKGRIIAECLTGNVISNSYLIS